MAGIAATLYTLLPRTLLRTYDAILVTGLAMLAAGIALLPFILREWPLAFIKIEYSFFGLYYYFWYVVFLFVLSQKFAVYQSHYDKFIQFV